MNTQASNSLAAVANDGERHLPALDPESINHYRHLMAYHFALGFMKGADVLDYGCGAGYGANLIWRRGRAASIVGVDSAGPAISYCQTAYDDLASCFRLVQPGSVPFSDGRFDVVLLLQTIEHVKDDGGLLLELSRVLRPGGTLLITTPNVTATQGDPQAPDNIHHIREYDRNSLRALCRAAFADIDEFGIHGSFRAGGKAFGLERWLLFRALRRVHGRFFPVVCPTPLSLADFRIERRDIEGALDLLFVCRKSNVISPVA